jgi:hypothetical protein
MMRRHLRPGLKPRLAFVDVRGLDEAEQVLQDLAVLMKPERVFVLTATATVPPSEIAALGFRVLRRPLTIAAIVGVVSEATSARLAMASIPGLAKGRADCAEGPTPLRNAM